MNITINGDIKPLQNGAMLLDVVAAVTGRVLNDAGHPADGTRLGVAVAHNREIARRAAWRSLPLNEGDDVEIVTAIQGG